MRTFPDLRMRQLMWEARKAQKHVDEGEHHEGRDAFLSLRARARKLGIESAYLCWGLAVAYDNLGELEMAFHEITAAVNLDPLNGSFTHSFEVIAQRIRAALADEERSLDDPSTPKLYDLLVAAGEADVPCHLAMARHRAHAGAHLEAMKLLDAVTLLSPVSRDAWLLKAAVSRAMGDLEAANHFEAEASAISAAPIPFGIPARVGERC